MLKEKIKQNKFYILTFLILFSLFLIPLPYYIEKDGGTISTKDRIKIENTESSGNFYMAYVSEIKVNIPTYIISLFNKDWTLIPKNEVVLTNETEEDEKFRSKLLLKESINNAIASAYTLANKKYEILNENYYVTYVDETAITDLKIQDKIIKINDTLVNNKIEIANIINNSKIGDTISIEVENKGKTYHRKSTLIEMDGKSVIGVMLTSEKTIETEPKIVDNFAATESGSSGGLMLALEIYDNITNKNISKNRKIAGTGTIDEYGNVGQIGGVKYKLKGVYNDGIKIFLVPNGENYEEAREVAKKENLDIQIIGVSTLEEAIKKLEEI